MINHSAQLMDRFPRIICTNCGTPSPTSQQEGTHIDDGISINVNDLGHYGGFNDNFPPKKGDPIAQLCHDCSVILFNALPGFAKFAEVHGGHGNLTGGWCFSGGETSDVINGTDIQPCCQYSWTWDRTDPDKIITYLATPDLTWEKHPQDQTEDSQ
jgi:hypothetical protein